MPTDNPKLNPSDQMQIAGIDYGSKRAGTTALALLDTGASLQLFQSGKGEDADAFLLKHLRQRQPTKVFMDAPLSLPGVYRYESDAYSDYFYRAADRELQAMSPMFLGGLTARAIQLQQLLSAEKITVYETYPARLAQVLELPKEQYKKKQQPPAALVPLLSAHCPLIPPTLALENWHQFDALLALISGWRFEQGQAACFGTETEGQIWI